MSEAMNEPEYLGDGAYARNDGPELIIYTDRREVGPDGGIVTVRHWVSLEVEALRGLVAYADRQWPGWCKS
jgi:hypothetical protein